MTKTEFRHEAGRAGLNPDLYGAVLSGVFYSLDGPMSGGKVAGIVWLDEWVTESRYSYMRGEHEEMFLSEVPYVILKKNQKMYRVRTVQITAYHDRRKTPAFRHGDIRRQEAIENTISGDSIK